MKKLLLLIALVLTICSTAMAETQKVSYLYPVYNTNGDPTSGIKEWKTASVDATVVKNSTNTLSGWCVVQGSDVNTGGLVCSGEVHLILADGANLTVKGPDYQTGILVSGEGNSLTIYGQTNQSGQLMAYGGLNTAGIGGADKGSGSNITINGGVVTANGGYGAAGIGGGNGGNGSNITINGGVVTANGGFGAAGIGGADKGSGSNITINGGKVTANGGYGAAGIGGGTNGSASNIIVATSLQVKADGSNPPATVIENNGGDLASSLAGKQYVTLEIILAPIKADAIAAIEEAVGGNTDADILTIANTAKENINNATSETDINNIKTFAIAKITAIAEIKSKRQGIKNAHINNWIDGAIHDIKSIGQNATPGVDDIKTQILDIINVFQDGKAEGKTEALGTLGTKQNGPALIVTDKDGKEVILYSPKSVEYIKVKE